MGASVSGIVISGEKDLRTEFSEFEVLDSKGFNVLVRAKRFGRWWILKGLKEEFRQSEAHRQLLRKEFEILNGMQHPGIVMAVGMEEVEEFGEIIVMEWVDGVTLKEWLKGCSGEETSGRSLDERLRVTFQIMDALEYVHSRQTAHRDLKPSNIMVTRNGGHVKLIDFGLADTDDYSIYKQPAGTEGYMSTEQMTSRVCDIRNDIYSLGCVLEDIKLGRRYVWIIRKCKAEAGESEAGGGQMKATARRGGRFNNIAEVRRAFRRVSSGRRGLVLTTIIMGALLAGYSPHVIHEHKIENIISEGRGLMDEIMSAVDTSAIKTREEASMIQYDVSRKLTEVWESYPASLSPSFSAAERESVKSALATHWSEIMKPLMQRIEELSTGSGMQK